MQVSKVSFNNFGRNAVNFGALKFLSEQQEKDFIDECGLENLRHIQKIADGVQGSDIHFDYRSGNIGDSVMIQKVDGKPVLAKAPSEDKTLLGLLKAYAARYTEAINPKGKKEVRKIF